MNAFTLWLAQGFGIGRIPVAPGTFGSIVGLLWFALLLVTQSLWVFAGGTILGIALAIRACGAAENILRKKDPGSVVLDEIAAMPVCFAGWIGILFSKTGALPAPDYFVSKENWLLTLGIFVAFRFFDIVKPWPVKQSQALFGGWGVAIDDVLAAIYVSAGTVLIQIFSGHW